MYFNMLSEVGFLTEEEWAHAKSSPKVALDIAGSWVPRLQVGLRSRDQFKRFLKEQVSKVYQAIPHSFASPTTKGQVDTFVRDTLNQAIDEA
uniref:Uncharacterized protein n=1 Tax=Zooxanthella nutricula TaxID=1333877 RepID=A0A7S2ISN9_9DINO